MNYYRPMTLYWGGGGGMESGFFLKQHYMYTSTLYLSLQDISKLKEMFPSETEASLANVLDVSLNVEDAIDTLVNKTAGQYQYEVHVIILCSGFMLVGSIMRLHVEYIHSTVKSIEHESTELRTFDTPCIFIIFMLTLNLVKVSYLVGHLIYYWFKFSFSLPYTYYHTFIYIKTKEIKNFNQR